MHRRLPPGPRSFVPGSYLLRYFRDPLRFFSAVAERYDEIAFFRIGPRSVCLVSEPHFIRELLVTQARQLQKGPGYLALRAVMGEGLVTSEGDLHRNGRRACQPFFDPERVNRHAETMVESALRVCGEWREGMCVDAYHEMAQVTLGTIVRALFGPDSTADCRRLLEHSEAVMSYWNSNWMPFLHLQDRLGISLFGAGGFRTARQQLDRQIYDLMAQRRADPTANGHDFLGQLLNHASQVVAPPPQTDRRIRDQLVTFLLAGYETLATALTWTWYLLDQNPAAEAALHRELDAKLSGRSPGLDDVPRLDYTRRVLAESLRLYPPGLIVSRTTLAEVAVGPYALPPGCVIVFSPYVAQRLPRYFPDPLRFDPDRWIDQPTDSTQANLPYFPFGVGPRRCIGEPFAWLEGQLVLATVAQHWRLRRTSDRPDTSALARFPSEAGRWDVDDGGEARRFGNVDYSRSAGASGAACELTGGAASSLAIRLVQERVGEVVAFRSAKGDMIADPTQD